MSRILQVLIAVNCVVLLIALIIIINILLVDRKSFQDTLIVVTDSPTVSRIMVNNSVTSARFTYDYGELALSAPIWLLTTEMVDVFKKIMNKFLENEVKSKFKSFNLQWNQKLTNSLYSCKTLSEYERSNLSLKTLVSSWPRIWKQNMGEILRKANEAEIHKATTSAKGCTFKLELTLDGGQVALFKPSWYRRDILIQGGVYDGNDRHFGEIAAFYLSLLLGYNSAPITVGRKVSLADEILPVADLGFKNKFYHNGGTQCFYGNCSCCTKSFSLCTNKYEIEGALVLFMNHKIKAVKNPWSHVQKCEQGEPAAWETSMKYCHRVTEAGLKHVQSWMKQQIILDMIAVTIFDFLIGNGDRHDFEFYSGNKIPDPDSHSGSILLIDNAKSFGNAYEDYVDLLAPLYQCCIIRRSLLTTLKKFHGTLGKSMDDITTFDPLYPILTADHLTALDRRLSIVFATVDVCIEQQSFNQQVVV